SGLKVIWNRSKEPLDDVFLNDADHRIERPRHSHVRDIGGAPGQNYLVSCWYMCVSTYDSRNAAVEIPSHCNFLGSRFTVHVDENHSDVLRNLTEFCVRNTKRVVC